MTTPTTSSSYWEHWYEVVSDNTLRQGDIFRDITVGWLHEATEPVSVDTPLESVEPSVQLDRGDFIILSASC